MHIETLTIDSLIPYARNSRTHSDAQVAQIAASMREFGFTNPVLIDNEGGIIAGHGRVMAARQLGMNEVPCIRLGHLTEAQRRLYVIADNKLGLNAGWDDNLLALELRELMDAGHDVGLTGFELADIDQLLAGLDATPEGNTDPDAMPPVETVAVSKLGDVWQLGKHRIMCGDSTSAADVALLMNGEKAKLMNTDPPYGVAYDNAERPNPGVAKPRVAKPRVAKPRVAKPRVANDELTDGAEMQAFLERMLQAAAHVMDEHAAYYFWHPMLTQGTYVAAAAAAAGILIHRQIIWVKPVLLLGRGDYHWKHELCFYGWKQGNRPPFYGPRNQHTIWEVGNVTHAERKEFNHATPKPVELFTRPMDNHLKAGEVCYEPFSGSGPQIIAAEQFGAKCFAMELHPQHVDVAIRRWQQFTGKTATHATTGVPFPG
jgi:DNA modification methylase